MHISINAKVCTENKKVRSIVSEGNSPSTQNSKKSLYSTVIYLCQLDVYHIHITFFFDKDTSAYDPFKYSHNY